MTQQKTKQLRVKSLELRETSGSNITKSKSLNFKSTLPIKGKLRGDFVSPSSRGVKEDFSSKLSSLGSKFSFGFTLIELIVVISILAILGTIAFISFSGYSASARDSSRMSDIASIYKSLSLY